MIKKDDKVSIIVPIFNMEKYLSRCIDSILMQTYKNIEVILVDDGSTDNCAAICKKYEQSFSNVIVVLKENGGVSTARNEGIKRASGEWLMFVDPDDYLDQSLIEVLIDYTNDQRDIIICTCTAVLPNGQRDSCHFFKGDREFTSFQEKKDLYKQLMKMNYGQAVGQIYTAVGVPWGKLYRRSMLEKSGLMFNEKLRRVQDNVFNIAAFSEANNILYLDRSLYMYSYEHMSGYFAKYKNNHSEIFTAVSVEKYACMRAYGLLEDQELCRYYINEAIIRQANILKFGIFHADNPESIKTKFEKARELRTLDCFDMYMNISGFKMIESAKYKLFWILLKLKCYIGIYLLSQIK